MTGIERDAQIREWFCLPYRRQRFRGTPKPRHTFARRFVLGEMQDEKTLCVTIRQDSRRLIVDLDRFVAESVRAINFLNEPGELIMGDCPLIFFQHAPPRMRPESSEILGSLAARRKDRQAKRQQRDPDLHTPATEHRQLDFALFNTMLVEC